MLSKSKRFRIAKKYGWKCQYCGRKVTFYPDKYTGLLAHIDHIIPVSKQGTNQDYNLTLACYECNISKSDNVGKSDIDRYNKQKKEWENRPGMMIK